MKHKRIDWRRLLLQGLVAAFIYYIISHFREVETLVKSAAQGNMLELTVALLLQVVYYFVYAGLYQSAFDTVGVSSRWRSMLYLVMSSHFLNVVAPAGGVSGAALFIGDAAERGKSPVKAATGTTITTLSELGTFAPILLTSLWFLFTHHFLRSYETAGAGILLAIIIGMGTALTVTLLFPDKLNKIISHPAALLNRLSSKIIHRELISHKSISDIEIHLREASGAIRNRPFALARTAGIAVVGHFVDIISLAAVFRAFGVDAGLGGIVAVYSMSILFWVVSPTPQGVGVVETVATLVLTSLGVPFHKALLVSLTFRGITFWLPLFTGMALIGKTKPFQTPQRTIVSKWEVRAASILVAAIGVLNVLSATTPALAERAKLLQPLLSNLTIHGANITTVTAGFGLLLVSSGIRRRKRVAWIITITLLITSVISHLIKGLDYEEAAIAGVIGWWLWGIRSHFNAKHDPDSVKHGLAVLSGSVLFTLAYGTFGLYILDKKFAVHYSFPAALMQTIDLFFGVFKLTIMPITRFGRDFIGSIYTIGALTMLYAVIQILKPLIVKHPSTPKERENARQIVEKYGRSSIAAMVLLPDKRYFFSSGGSVIGYAVSGGVCLALGDPIGPGEDCLTAITEFISECEHTGLSPAFYQTLPDYLTHYTSAGFNALCIGQEAIIDLDSFNTQGKDRQSLRTSINKLTKIGIRAEILQPPLTETQIEDLREVSDAWLAMMRGSEKQFSLGWFDEEYIRTCPVITLSKEDGSILAFANIISEFQLNEISIDLMRRIPDAPNGTMDMLFVELIHWAQENKINTFNLGLSPLAGVGEGEDSPLPERVVNLLYKHANQFYSFKGLHAFKEKFGPEWEPRYLIYRGHTNLPATAYAIVSADSGQGIVRSYLLQKLKPLGRKRCSAS